MACLPSNLDHSITRQATTLSGQSGSRKGFDSVTPTVIDENERVYRPYLLVETAHKTH
jgi:hypothetical protein